jgi:hypothetical protein
MASGKHLPPELAKIAANQQNFRNGFTWLEKKLSQLVQELVLNDFR